MESSMFETSLKYAKSCLDIKFDLSSNQTFALKSLFKLQDTVVVMPTGSGKSVIFQLLPWLLQRKMESAKPMVVIIVSPLNSLMEDQVGSLCEKGIHACYINIDASKVHTVDKDDDESVKSSDDEDDEKDISFISTATLGDIKAGKYNIVYMHPETIFSKEVGRLLRARTFKPMVCCTVVDEVHMISEWGTDFRQSFVKLGELTCMFPHIPHLALTATATPDSIEKLVQTLQFRNCNKVLSNPDRPNIYIEIRRRLPNIKKYEKYEAIMSDIIAEIKVKKTEYPVTIIYCDNLESLGYCFQLLCCEVGNDAYSPVGSKIPEDRIIAQYHKDYTQKMKSHIISELRKVNPKIRLVMATVALGMGLNAPSVNRIIHMRPPTTLEKYLQEIGRAGRNGQEAHAICFYNNSDIAKNRKGLNEAVIKYVENQSTCLRKQLVEYFGYDTVLHTGPQSTCCSNCFKQSQLI